VHLDVKTRWKTHHYAGLKRCKKTLNLRIRHFCVHMAGIPVFVTRYNTTNPAIFPLVNLSLCMSAYMVHHGITFPAAILQSRPTGKTPRMLIRGPMGGRIYASSCSTVETSFLQFTESFV
jgi:hypothetical protein